MKRTASRGQPVISLALLLASWIGARAMLLEAADANPSIGGAVEAAASDSSPGQIDNRTNAVPLHGLAASGGPIRAPSAAAPGATSLAPPPALPAVAAEPPATVLAPIAEPSPRVDPIAEPQAPNPFRGKPRLAGGHQLLWLAALAQLPLPPEAMPGQSSAKPEPLPKLQTSRWSGDGWLLLRRGGSGAGALGGAPAS